MVDHRSKIKQLLRQNRGYTLLPLQKGNLFDVRNQMFDLRSFIVDHRSKIKQLLRQNRWNTLLPLKKGNLLDVRNQMFDLRCWIVDHRSNIGHLIFMPGLFNPQIQILFYLTSFEIFLKTSVPENLKSSNRMDS
jgi:hypothetical protein